ncbi:hypothetical protein GCT13_27250 [Paraburkholderia sp. CNPSo 3157]|uniref:Uncharacterized protein n=1 Tax=Paraburkholderia franconis TaxID=2654983 RepID=A0A7X1NEP0_9BURK|nr:hypothetical protein [Paraburkholderia franconis]MPW20479.1 hypothetical protein [Paraburkholderia franconis]
MKDARSLLFSRRGWLKTAGGIAAGAAVGSLGLLPREATAATIYPIDSWLKAQGQFFGQLPPAANYADWFSRLATLHNAPTPPILLATVDYAGLANQFFNFGTTIDYQNSQAIVQPLTDGSGNVSVHVLLYTHNANTWVIQLTGVVNGQLPPDFNTQLSTNPELFGVRPVTGASLSGACLGDSFLDLTYVTTPGNLWVDLLAANLQRVGFRSQATGPLTKYYSAQYGVPEGTLGRCAVSQTGLLAISTNSNSRVALDAFPAESVDLHPLG